MLTHRAFSKPTVDIAFLYFLFFSRFPCSFCCPLFLSLFFFSTYIYYSYFSFIYLFYLLFPPVLPLPTYFFLSPLYFLNVHLLSLSDRPLYPRGGFFQFCQCVCLYFIIEYIFNFRSSWEYIFFLNFEFGCPFLFVYCFFVFCFSP